MASQSAFLVSRRAAAEGKRPWSLANAIFDWSEVWRNRRADYRRLAPAASSWKRNALGTLLAGTRVDHGRLSAS